MSFNFLAACQCCLPSPLLPEPRAPMGMRNGNAGSTASPRASGHSCIQGQSAPQASAAERGCGLDQGLLSGPSEPVHTHTPTQVLRGAPGRVINGPLPWVAPPRSPNHQHSCGESFEPMACMTPDNVKGLAAHTAPRKHRIEGGWAQGPDGRAHPSHCAAAPRGTVPPPPQGSGCSSPFRGAPLCPGGKGRATGGPRWEGSQYSLEGSHPSGPPDSPSFGGWATPNSAVVSGNTSWGDFWVLRWGRNTHRKHSIAKGGLRAQRKPRWSPSPEASPELDCRPWPRPAQ